MERYQKLLSCIDKSMKVLEIGPSFNPVTPKSQGWNSFSLDHADQEALREKYRSCPEIDKAAIEPVDFICPDGVLDRAIPPKHHGTFDACIASHVIEHLPDPIDFYRALATLLRPTGVVALAVPDKRFCFDYFRMPSLASEFIIANRRRHHRHTSKTAFEETAYAANVGGRIAWGQAPVEDLRLNHPLRRAFEALVEADQDEGPYLDYHGWCYTPSSFKLVMLELNVLELLDWQIVADFPAEGCEFIAILRRGGLAFASDEALADARRTLLAGIIADIAEQHAYAAHRRSPASAGRLVTLPIASLARRCGSTRSGTPPR